MKTKFTRSPAIGLVALASICDAQDYPKTPAEAEKLAQGLKCQHGEVNLPCGLGKLNIPDEFKLLSPADTAIVWKNCGAIRPQKTSRACCWLRAKHASRRVAGPRSFLTWMTAR